MIKYHIFCKTALEAAEKALMDCKIRLANNGIPEPETLDEALAQIKALKGD